MLIGLTYDLRSDHASLSEEAQAEFDSPETVAALREALEALGHRVEPVGHVRALARRLVDGARWDIVFNIAEGLSGRSREAQVPALLEAFAAPYVFSDPLTQALGLDKAMAKRVVRDAGAPTAPFRVLADAADDAACDLPFPAFLKPLAEGTGKGCEAASRVETAEALARTAVRLRARFAQPALAETYLPGREFTVGVLGEGADAQVVGVMEVRLTEVAEPGVYSFANKEACETRVSYRLADDASARRAGEIALAAHRALGCRDAARHDLRCDGEGAPNWLEVNTLPGLHPTHSDLPILSALAGVPYRDLIARILAHACARHGLAQVARRRAS
jgi:D-alanine-D-alanine ligase